MIEVERVLATNRAVHAAAVKDAHTDPARCYSVARARVMPTTFIIKARKPFAVDRAAQHYPFGAT